MINDEGAELELFLLLEEVVGYVVGGLGRGLGK